MTLRQLVQKVLRSRGDGDGLPELLRRVDEHEQQVNARIASLEILLRQLADNVNNNDTILGAKLAGIEHTLEEQIHSFQAWHASQNGVETLDPFVREGTGPYPGFCQEARALGLDPNDYMQDKLNWTDVRPVLERKIFPLLRPDSTVCELGPGTGRWSRYLAPRLSAGALHLVDYSPWFVRFLRDYFKNSSHVHVHQTDGFSLPLPEQSVDLLVSFATFVMLKAGTILCYARAFHRVLRPGGWFALEYLDPSTDEGRAWMELHTKPDSATIFTYHTAETISQIFESAGLEIIEHDQVSLWHPEHVFTLLLGRRP